MKCQTCGNDNPEKAQFCGRCGAALGGAWMLIIRVNSVNTYNYWAVTPPSMTNSLPVTNEDSSDAR